MRARMFLFAVFAMLFIARCPTAETKSSPTPDRQGEIGDKACAKCHESIYRSYKSTPMAHASGLAMENLMTADFTYERSKAHFRIYSASGRAWLTFDREGDRALHGQRELLYYIGSGRRGLTYLFEQDGFLFESPINWYANEGIWDMTPAYQQVHEVPMNLPAHSHCLNCHVSGMRPPLSNTENHYAMPVITHSGIDCERCHGPTEAHLKGGPIVNPAKLPAERRDSVCMECHMEGRVSVERPGRHIYEFRPGDLLSDYLRYYVTSDESSRLGAVSQVEALAQSQCRKTSGDRMSCMSCHDPHFEPRREEKAAYYRSKCLACHGGEFGSKHHPKQADCVACHMPASSSKDIQHTEVTDHRIPRLPARQQAELRSDSSERIRLIPFPDTREAESDLRDLALAWEKLADNFNEAARPQAESMLRKSAKEFPNDPETLSALGYAEQRHGEMAAARGLYTKALALDPYLIDAATNLGVIEAQNGEFGKAIRLWRDAFDRAPGRSSIGMNLARLLCATGKFDEARSYTERVLQFNPDLNAANELQRSLSQPRPNCHL
jgi:Flp pilus assembly protein TadD